MNRVLPLLLLAGIVAGVYATESRVLSMGDNDAFYMDETSIFRNPANISIYPNMIMGSYGVYDYSASNDSSQYAALERQNREPREPFFGAILTYSFKGDEGGSDGAQHPMLSIAGVFNRRDPHTAPLYSSFKSSEGDTTWVQNPVEPVGKIDILVGYATASGVKLGLGGYMAIQKDDEGNNTPTLTSTFYRGTAGLNWPITRTMDLEASLGVGSLSIIAPDSTYRKGVDTTVGVDTLARNDLSIDADVRLFSAMTSINGDLVPHVAVNWSQFHEGQQHNLDVAAGLGLNVNIDKGFFWAGLEFLSKYQYMPGDEITGFGGRVSFGVERNVVWDWLVVRVGGQKVLMYQTEGSDKSKWVENPENNSYDDLVNLGIGLNLENRLKFDILVAKDIPYTLTNLFSGPEDHIFTRIDATLSF